MKDLEQRLAEDLDRAASSIEPTQPNLAEIRSRGRHEPSRLVPLLAVAAVVLVIVGVSFGVRHWGPFRTSEPPVVEVDRSAPKVPYVYDGTLFVGDQSFALEESEQVFGADGRVLIERFDDGVLSLRTVVDGVERALPASAGDAQLTFDGRFAFWMELHHHFTDLVVWDVDAGRVTIRHRIDVDFVIGTGGGPGHFFAGVDAQGRIYWDEGQGLVMWDPADPREVPVQMPRQGYVDSIGPLGPVWGIGDEGESENEDGIYYATTATGELQRLTDLTAPRGAWSTDGRYFAAPAHWSLDAFGSPIDADMVMAVNDTFTGEKFALYVGTDEEDLAWESATSLIVRDRQRLLRCQAPEWTCDEIASFENTGPTLLRPGW